MSHNDNLEYNSNDASYLNDRINEEYSKYGKVFPFSFTIQDKENNIIAGCSGSIVYGCAYTNQLWIHPDYNKNGLGFELMNKVHDFGVKNGCKIAGVFTMSFQDTIDFYKKAGYIVDFERSGYVKNSKCIFLKRSL